MRPAAVTPMSIQTVLRVTRRHAHSCQDASSFISRWMEYLLAAGSDRRPGPHRHVQPPRAEDVTATVRWATRGRPGWEARGRVDGVCVAAARVGGVLRGLVGWRPSRAAMPAAGELSRLAQGGGGQRKRGGCEGEAFLFPSSAHSACLPSSPLLPSYSSLFLPTISFVPPLCSTGLR